MQWISPYWLMVLALLALVNAAIAAVISLRARRTASEASAAIAQLSGVLSGLERAERLTPSTLAELAAVRDAIDKGNALLKRIASRETMRDRRENPAFDAGSSKDDLRRRAGLIAGKPAPHQ